MRVPPLSKTRLPFWGATARERSRRRIGALGSRITPRPSDRARRCRTRSGLTEAHASIAVTLEHPLTEVERWLYEHAPPEPLESARAIYELMPSQSDRSLAWVYAPLDAWSVSHWSDVARIADYVAHVPDDGRRVLDVGPGDGWPALPVAACGGLLGILVRSRALYRLRDLT